MGVIKSERTRQNAYAMRYVAQHFVTNKEVTLINSKLFLKGIVLFSDGAVIYSK